MSGIHEPAVNTSLRAVYWPWSVKTVTMPVASSTFHVSTFSGAWKWAPCDCAALMCAAMHSSDARMPPSGWYTACSDRPKCALWPLLFEPYTDDCHMQSQVMHQAVGTSCCNIPPLLQQLMDDTMCSTCAYLSSYGACCRCKFARCVFEQVLEAMTSP